MSEGLQALAQFVNVSYVNKRRNNYIENNVGLAVP